MNIKRILDVLLLPKTLYQKITDKRPSLFLGIILVGIMDMAFILTYNDSYRKFFWAKSQSTLYFNITFTACAALILGLVDILFFSLPLFDLFKFFKKEGESRDSGATLIKVMKIYILANFLILPANILSIVAEKTPGVAANTALIGILAFLYIVVNVWLCAAVTRGINSIYNFQLFYRRMVFLFVYLWNFLLGSAFQYIILHWVLALYK
ncbi:MAG: hypothetical protein QHH06_11785 [Clostridiales bacterium]|jgi:hypothetical protein|nr:hypothetical protein [Eubacteriales bacterium]MDH7567139.1 hypothetical protein [Clostridiales bacterium]